MVWNTCARAPAQKKRREVPQNQFRKFLAHKTSPKTQFLFRRFQDTDIPQRDTVLDVVFDGEAIGELRLHCNAL